MSPPPGQPPTPHGDTGTRSNAETKTASRTANRRALVGRILDHGRRRGVKLAGWQVRNVLRTLEESGAIRQPTDEQVLRALMAAPWFPKPRVRQHQLGGVGWRVTS